MAQRFSPAAVMNCADFHVRECKTATQKGNADRKASEEDMELSKAIGSIAILLAICLAAGYALGEEDLAESPAVVAVQQ